MALEVAGATDRGTVRDENQDAWHAEDSPDGGVFLVLADGMGGHAGGRESAEAAVDAAAQELAGADADRGAAVRAAVAAANRAVDKVRDVIGGNPGTTLVVALVNPQGDVVVGNVGDSRAYLVRGSEARPVTEDHSWVGEQVRLGAIAPESARHHPRRNLITRAVMGDPVEPDVFELRLEPGDILLLCSDGVWEPLSDAAIADAARVNPLQAAVDTVCRRALDEGSRDNVTVVAARLSG
ncbi:MAG TPA: protein phosphatase 2C domain-containing protein [Candidatus Dormibacteraeota bacterium]|nr:protein phosphatase 2C domain-containing protein [Candidatus Dormibacteraeota bacterium]